MLELDGMRKPMPKKTHAQLDAEIAGVLAGSPAAKAPSSAVKLTVKRSKDFRDEGTYDVRDETGALVALLFRDPESREWYEAELPGTPQIHYVERWRGGTQAEALESVTRRITRHRGL